MADNLFIGDLDPKAAVRLVESTSDLVVLLDAEGHVIDVAVHDASLTGLGANTWAGRSWVDTVTVESREKILASL